MGSHGDMSIAELCKNLKEWTTQQNDKLLEDIKMANDALKTELSKKIDDVGARMGILERNQEDVQNRLSILENAHKGETYEVNKLLYREVEDRLTRKKNVMIYNIPENDSKDYLKNYLMDLLQEAPFDPQSVRYFRMGKKTNDKSRPVKLVLNDSEDAMWVLIHQKEFCKDDVYCGNDKTPQQQEYLASLKAELNERKKKGETKLMIKYLKGTPTIVEKIVAESGQVKYQQQGIASSSKQSTSQLIVDEGKKLINGKPRYSKN
ncbi:hypothetical protein QAD02_003045 [Eretmocerus hayati]|uniref:Uncharacterized protein n=1 Tax=Eretmocerus hayati TaxID=131215 RepID=A0ACC2NMD2_9HYME|nr:hypothetical protein QAD02_003045 [Eretmocerus hayati]